MGRAMWKILLFPTACVSCMEITREINAKKMKFAVETELFPLTAKPY